MCVYLFIFINEHQTTENIHTITCKIFHKNRAISTFMTSMHLTILHTISTGEKNLSHAFYDIKSALSKMFSASFSSAASVHPKTSQKEFKNNGSVSCSDTFLPSSCDNEVTPLPLIPHGMT